MTFEEYKQGLKEVAKNHNDLDIKLYNSKVNKDCNFKVNIGDLIANIEKVHKVKDASVGAIITLSPGFTNNPTGESFIGVVIVGITYNSPDLRKPVVEELAKFRVDHNTPLTDGTTLRENTYIHKDYGRVRLRLMPETNVNDLIVKLDLTNEYMMYPVFVKALLKCNIIENQEQTFTK